MSLAALTRASTQHGGQPRMLDPIGHFARAHGRGEPATATIRQRIELDEGLTCFLGRCGLGDVRLPRSARWLVFSRNDAGATLSVSAVPGSGDLGTSDLIIAICGVRCERAFDYVPPHGRWYLSTRLRAIAAAITGDAGDRPGQVLWLRAKGLELACETIGHLRAGTLVPCCGAGDLTEVETRRLMAARELIETRLDEALSLNQIARTCGLNRSKLTRGFRLLNGVSVATFIGNMRMAQAKALLLTTDLPVATVGFRCGYQSNASFARAFVRHHGMSPVAMRGG